ncbi:MAG: hypothetical protein JWR69_1762 [Pedosphaera sp.]|nr:hypothetical protein [Pedosphaera sp.]
MLFAGGLKRFPDSPAIYRPSFRLFRVDRHRPSHLQLANNGTADQAVILYSFVRIALPTNRFGIYHSL